jgi:hypothetical protein
MAQQGQPFYWVIPGKLAGMPFPYIDTQRRLAGGGNLTAYNDVLPVLHAAGIRGVAALVNLSSDAKVYAQAGLSFINLPIPDGFPPTRQQVTQFVAFADEQIAQGHAAVAHCHAGLGRTGTILAAYLIAKGSSAAAAIDQVRAAQPSAIETRRQVEFLHQLAMR